MRESSTLTGGPSPDPFEHAYDKGCMWGIAGGRQDLCPYNHEALAEWWHHGWEDGATVWHRHPGEPGGRHRVR